MTDIHNPQTAAARKSVTLVLGMHRSGTSALTNLLARMGLHTGDRLIPANEYNPAGHYEDRDVLAINEAILGRLGGIWHHPLDLTGLYQQLQTGELDDLLEQAGVLLAERLEQQADWLVKEPRLSLLLPFWIQLFTAQHIDIRLLWIIRHPDDVAASLRQRDALAKDHIEQLWLAYNLGILQNLQGREAYLLDYDSLLEQPEIIARELAIHLGKPLPQDELSRAIAQSIHPDLHRNHARQPSDHPLYRQLHNIQPAWLDAPRLASLWLSWQDRMPWLTPAWQWANRLDTASRQLDAEQQHLNGYITLIEEQNVQLKATNAELHDALAQARQETQQARSAEQQARAAEQQARAAEQHALYRAEQIAQSRDQISEELAAIKNSMTWRITAPQRRFIDWVKRPKAP